MDFSLDFLIIGAQRSGTTSLYNYLIKHPKVLPASTKEIHFFDKNFKKGFDWYKSQFLSKKKGCIRGEATPYYLYYPLARERIFKVFPDVKLIVILRNPIDRAFSHYQLEVKRPSEKFSFEKAIEMEPERLKDEKEKIISDLSYRGLKYQRYSYLSRGIYAEQLKNWFKIYPKNQFLILKSEDFYENPQEIMNQVFQFLNLSSFVIPEFSVFQKISYDKMSDSTRKKLEEFFRPHNEELYKLIGKNFDW